MMLNSLDAIGHFLDDNCWIELAVETVEIFVAGASPDKRRSTLFHLLLFICKNLTADSTRTGDVIATTFQRRGIRNLRLL
jgi:hypothetical protein